MTEHERTMAKLGTVHEQIADGIEHVDARDFPRLGLALLATGVHAIQAMVVHTARIATALEERNAHAAGSTRPTLRPPKAPPMALPPPRARLGS